MPPTKKKPLPKRRTTVPTQGVRIPPHSYEAEQSVLGSLLIDKDALIRVADFLEPDDFYKSVHGLMYHAMIDLYQASQPIDVVSVVNRLREKKELTTIGGEAGVAHLTTVVPTAGNIMHYAKIVKKAATLRRLISTASEITEIGFAEDEEIDVLLDRAEQALFSVSQDQKQYSFTRVSEALEAAFERIDKLHKGEHDLRGVPTGFSALDNKLAGWQKSDLIILAARPSVGKTSLALDFGRHAAINGASVGLFSLEMSKEQLVDRMLAAHAHVDLWRLRTGRLETTGEYDDFSRLGHAMGELSNLPIFIDDHTSNNVMGMRTMARRLQSEHGLDLLIIDYLQLMESSRYADNRVQEVSDISRSLKRLAIELSIPIIALSQLSRGVEMRTDQRPKLSDLRESGCVTGDTLITRADTGQQVRIQDLAERPEQTPIPVFALDCHYRIVTRPLTKAFYSGKKTVYLLRTRTGRSIRASANHPFRKLDGWRRLDQLAPGDRIALPRELKASAPKNSLVKKERVGASWRELQAGIGMQYAGSSLYKSAPSRERLARVATAVQSKKLQQLATSDILWDEILTIEKQGMEDVYDATVPGLHNFVANDIIIHNSIEQDADVVMFIHRPPLPGGEERPEVMDVSLLVEKHRNGPTGELPLRFHSRFASFTEPDDTYAELSQLEAQEERANTRAVE